MPQENPFESARGRTDAQSFLFEMHVLLGLLEGLRGRGWQVTEAAPQVEPMRFLRAPGNKRGTTFFRAKKAAEDVQVVHGSGVQDRFGASQHPDVSIQQADAGLEPTADDILAMWDMKLKGDFGISVDSRIEKDDVATFNLMVSELGLQPPGEAMSRSLLNLVSNGDGHDCYETCSWASSVLV
jgi:hypothetical protein